MKILSIGDFREIFIKDRYVNERKRNDKESGHQNSECPSFLRKQMHADRLSILNPAYTVHCW